MSKAGADTQQTSVPSAVRCLPILSMVGLCIAVDVIGIRFVAANWEKLSPFIPHALLTIGIAAIVLRARAVLLNRAP